MELNSPMQIIGDVVSLLTKQRDLVLQTLLVQLLLGMLNIV